MEQSSSSSSSFIYIIANYLNSITLPRVAAHGAISCQISLFGFVRVLCSSRGRVVSTGRSGFFLFSQRATVFEGRRFPFSRRDQRTSSVGFRRKQMLVWCYKYALCPRFYKKSYRCFIIFTANSSKSISYHFSTHSQPNWINFQSFVNFQPVRLKGIGQPAPNKRFRNSHSCVKFDSTVRQNFFVFIPGRVCKSDLCC